MRMRCPLDDILGRRSNVALLRELVRTRVEATGRDLARFVGLDHKTCLASLAHLEREGIVFRRRVGKAWLHRLKGDFPFVTEVLEPLFKWEYELPERLAKDILKGLGKDALSVFLFGSTAKGTDEAKSDIDLLVVVRTQAVIPAMEDRADQLFHDVLKKYSRVPTPFFMDANTFRTKFMNNDPFVREVVRTGNLLDGLRVEEVLDLGRKTNRRRGSP